MSAVTIEDIQRAIDEIGFVITNVCPSPHAILHTIGLTRIGWPEFVVTGMTLRQGGHYINLMVYFLRTAGREPPIGEAFDGPMVFPSKFIETSPYRPLLVPRLPESVPAVQLLWTDAQGRYPDDAGYDPKFKQQVLV